MDATLLTSTLNLALDLNIDNAQTGGIGLRVGFGWWSLAIALAAGLEGTSQALEPSDALSA